MRGVLEWTALGLLLLITVGCAGTDEQAVRHAVTAELIERYRVDEEHVHLVHVESASGSWVVRAEISSGGRAGAKRLLTCRVERTASSGSQESRWTLTTVEDREVQSSGADVKQ